MLPEKKRCHGRTPFDEPPLWLCDGVDTPELHKSSVRRELSGQREEENTQLDNDHDEESE